MGRYDLTDFEWRVIEPLLPNKPRGVPRVLENQPDSPLANQSLAYRSFPLRSRGGIGGSDQGDSDFQHCWVRSLGWMTTCQHRSSGGASGKCAASIRARRRAANWRTASRRRSIR